MYLTTLGGFGEFPGWKGMGLSHIIDQIEELHGDNTQTHSGAPTYREEGKLVY